METPPRGGWDSGAHSVMDSSSLLEIIKRGFGRGWVCGFGRVVNNF